MTGCVWIMASCNGIDHAMLLPRIAGTNSQALSSRVLPRRLFIGAALLVALILCGIGVVMVWAPNVAEAKSDDVVASNAPVRPDVIAPASEKCMECGVIESRRTIVQDEDAAAPGAATPMIVGGLKEIRRSPVSVSEVTVRMNDGTSRRFVDEGLSNSHTWRTGERMIFIEGVRASNH